MGGAYVVCFWEGRVRRSCFLAVAIVGRKEFWKGGSKLIEEDLITFQLLNSIEKWV